MRKQRTWILLVLLLIPGESYFLVWTRVLHEVEEFPTHDMEVLKHTKKYD